MRSIILLVVVLMSVAAVSNRVCHLATRASVGVATDVRQIFVPRWASLVYLFVPVHISKPGLIFAQTFGVAGDGKLFSTIVLKYWQTVRPRKQSKVDKARSVATTPEWSVSYLFSKSIETFAQRIKTLLLLLTFLTYEDMVVL